MKTITCPNCNAIFDMRDVVATPVAQPSVAPAPIAAPEVKPSVAPAPSGPQGSKTNPFKVDKPTSKVWNGLIPENAANDSVGDIGILATSKVYFEVDPNGIPFKLFVGFYEGAGTVCRLTQNKITGQFSAEESRGSDGYFDIVTSPLPDTKYLYAIDNSLSPGAVHDKMWVQIPFNP
jgi:hypothetical protein